MSRTLQQSDEGLSRFVQAVPSALKIPDDGWNVIALGQQAFRVSDSPRFFGKVPVIAVTVGSLDVHRLLQPERP